MSQPKKTMLNSTELISSHNCFAPTALEQMVATKNEFNKNNGRMFYQFVQSFPSDTKLTPQQVNQIGLEFAEKQFGDFEVLVATHVDTNNLHNHLILNSVSCVDGKKLHQNHDDLLNHRKANDEICLKYGEKPLAKYEKGKRNTGISSAEYRTASRGESYKFQLINTIDYAMKKAKTRDEFIRILASKKYEILWSDTRKYITYTVPNGKKVRCNKLHEEKYTKEKMEYEFKLREEINGGRTQKYKQASERMEKEQRRLSKDTDKPSNFVGADRQYAHRDNRENKPTIDQHSSCSTDEQNEFIREYTSENFARNEPTGWEQEREIVFSAENKSTEFRDHSRENMYHIGLTRSLDALAIAVKLANSLDGYTQTENNQKKYKIDRKALKKLAERKRAKGIKHSEIEDFEMKGY